MVFPFPQGQLSCAKGRIAVLLNDPVLSRSVPQDRVSVRRNARTDEGPLRKLFVFVIKTHFAPQLGKNRRVRQSLTGPESVYRVVASVRLSPTLGVHPVADTIDLASPAPRVHQCRCYPRCTCCVGHSHELSAGTGALERQENHSQGRTPASPIGALLVSSSSSCRPARR